MRKKLAAVLSSLAVVAGCATPGPETYRDEKPALDLMRYFDGTVDAWGQFAERSGKVVKRFKVVIHGRLEGETLVLDERFSYSDGSTQRRVWTIRRDGAHSYTGVMLIFEKKNVTNRCKILNFSLGFIVLSCVMIFE